MSDFYPKANLKCKARNMFSFQLIVLKNNEKPFPCVQNKKLTKRQGHGVLSM